jgi:hypothetical protein
MIEILNECLRFRYEIVCWKIEKQCYSLDFDRDIISFSESYTQIKQCNCVHMYCS